MGGGWMSGSVGTRSVCARSACLLTLLLAAALPARADRDLVGVTSAKFTWSPADGDVVAYRIYVERNDGGFEPHPTMPIKTEGDRVVSVSGNYGDVIRVEVAALTSLDEPEGPHSDPSERIRFLAADETPPPDGAPGEPPIEPPVTPPANPPALPPIGSNPGSGAPNDATTPDFD